MAAGLDPLGMSDRIKVFVRIRPLNAREVAEERDLGVPSTWKWDDKTICDDDDLTKKAFNFDLVFGTQSNNGEVYNGCAKLVVQKALAGINGTVFAYGQTGSGKTHSMLGTSRDPGTVPRAIHDVFKHIEAASRSGTEFLVRVSYLEVYNEEVNDLLQPGQRGKGRNLRILRDDPSRGAFVESLTEDIVVSREQVLEVVARGEANRHYGATAVHAGSSRSHTIFRMIIESKMPDSDGTSTMQGGGERGEGSPGLSGVVRMSYLNLVDLAGSERQEAAGTSGERLREGGFINKSLSALSLVISKLAEQSKRGERERAGQGLTPVEAVDDGEDERSSLGSVESAFAPTGFSTRQEKGRTSSVGSARSIEAATPSAAAAGRKSASAAFPASARKRRQGTYGDPGSLPPPVPATTEHIPYRNSKLTRLLRQSIGGNATTAILCTFTPSGLSRDESISTLKFGQACKSITNRAVVNAMVDDKTLLRQYRTQIQDLQTQMATVSAENAGAKAQAVAALNLLVTSAAHEPDATAIVAALQQNELLRNSSEALSLLSPLIHRVTGSAPTPGWFKTPLPVRRQASRITPDGQSAGLAPPVPGGSALDEFGLGGSSPVAAALVDTLRARGVSSPPSQQLAEAIVNMESSSAKAAVLEVEQARLQGLIIAKGQNVAFSTPPKEASTALSLSVAPVLSPEDVLNAIRHVRARIRDADAAAGSSPPRRGTTQPHAYTSQDARGGRSDGDEIPGLKASLEAASDEVSRLQAALESAHVARFEAERRAAEAQAAAAAVHGSESRMKVLEVRFRDATAELESRHEFELAQHADRLAAAQQDLAAGRVREAALVASAAELVVAKGTLETLTLQNAEMKGERDELKKELAGALRDLGEAARAVDKANRDAADAIDVANQQAAAAINAANQEAAAEIERMSVLVDESRAEAMQQTEAAEDAAETAAVAQATSSAAISAARDSEELAVQELARLEQMWARTTAAEAAAKAGTQEAEALLAVASSEREEAEARMTAAVVREMLLLQREKVLDDMSTALYAEQGRVRAALAGEQAAWAADRAAGESVLSRGESDLGLMMEAARVEIEGMKASLDEATVALDAQREAQEEREREFEGHCQATYAAARAQAWFRASIFRMCARREQAASAIRAAAEASAAANASVFAGLEASTAHLNDSIGRFNVEKADFNIDLKALEARLAVLEAREAAVEAGLHDIRAREEELEHGRVTVVHARAGLEMAAAEHRAAMAREEAAMAARVNSVSRSEEDIALRSGHLLTLQADLEASATRADTRTTELMLSAQKMRDEAEARTRDLGARAAELEASRAEVGHAASDLSRREDELSRQTRDYMEQLDRLNALLQDADAREVEIRAREAEVEELTAKAVVLHSDLESRLADVQGEINRREMECRARVTAAEISLAEREEAFTDRLEEAERGLAARHAAFEDHVASAREEVERDSVAQRAAAEAEAEEITSAAHADAMRLREGALADAGRSADECAEKMADTEEAHNSMVKERAAAFEAALALREAAHDAMVADRAAEFELALTAKERDINRLLAEREADVSTTLAKKESDVLAALFTRENAVKAAESELEGRLSSRTASVHAELESLKCEVQAELRAIQEAAVQDMVAMRESVSTELAAYKAAQLIAAQADADVLLDNARSEADAVCRQAEEGTVRLRAEVDAWATGVREEARADAEHLLAIARAAAEAERADAEEQARRDFAARLEALKGREEELQQTEAQLAALAAAEASLKTAEEVAAGWEVVAAQQMALAEAVLQAREGEKASNEAAKVLDAVTAQTEAAKDRALSTAIAAEAERALLANERQALEAERRSLVQLQEELRVQLEAVRSERAAGQETAAEVAERLEKEFEARVAIVAEGEETAARRVLEAGLLTEAAAARAEATQRVDVALSGRAEVLALQESALKQQTEELNRAQAELDNAVAAMKREAGESSAREADTARALAAAESAASLALERLSQATAEASMRIAAAAEVERRAQTESARSEHRAVAVAAAEVAARAREADGAAALENRSNELAALASSLDEKARALDAARSRVAVEASSNAVHAEGLSLRECALKERVEAMGVREREMAAQAAHIALSREVTASATVSATTVASAALHEHENALRAREGALGVLEAKTEVAGRELLVVQGRLDAEQRAVRASEEALEVARAGVGRLQAEVEARERAVADKEVLQALLVTVTGQARALARALLALKDAGAISPLQLETALTAVAKGGVGAGGRERTASTHMHAEGSLVMSATPSKPALAVVHGSRGEQKEKEGSPSTSTPTLRAVPVVIIDVQK